MEEKQGKKKKKKQRHRGTNTISFKRLKKGGNEKKAALLADVDISLIRKLVHKAKRRCDCTKKKIFRASSSLVSLSSLLPQKTK